jgi:hypothetical protein
VAAKVFVGPKSCRDHLRHLAVVFAVELRLKIVTELYMREMSPTQFRKEFGGGSASRVARNFETLEKHGWLRYVRSAPGRGGKGVENFYRATEPAFIDAETWALVPYSMRVASSWKIFNQIASRLRQAMEASLLEARLGRDLTSTSLLLDHDGWERVIDAVTTQFVVLFEEQKDAQLRVRHSGEELIRANVFQIGFQAPRSDDTRVGPVLAENHSEPPIPFFERLSPVFADDICMRIVAELNRRDMSVTQFHREFGGATFGGIYRRFKRLKEVGWLAKVNEETGGRRRGATEIFYRATVPAMDGNTPWAKVPDSLAATNNWKIFERLSVEMKAAMKAGTFDARPDRILAWSLLSFDRQGWRKVIAEIDALLEFALDQEEQAADRMAKSGEKPIRMVVALAALESLSDAVKAP